MFFPNLPTRSVSTTNIDLPNVIQLDGVKLLPHTIGKNLKPPHKILYWSNGPNTVIRHGPWKLIRSGESKWMCDLSTDIGETKNLVATHSEKLRELEKWHK